LGVDPGAGVLFGGGDRFGLRRIFAFLAAHIERLGEVVK
jgi:hypothetical protein